MEGSRVVHTPVLDLLHEDVVHECLLSTGAAAGPVGVTRVGDVLQVRLFPGGLCTALIDEGRGTVHLTDDPVVLLLALEGDLAVVAAGSDHSVPGCFASIAVEVLERSQDRITDDLGGTAVELLTLGPTACTMSAKGPRALCRGDGQLLEALVHATRARIPGSGAAWERRTKEEANRLESALAVVVRTRPDGRELARRVRSLLEEG